MREGNVYVVLTIDLTLLMVSTWRVVLYGRHKNIFFFIVTFWPVRVDDRPADSMGVRAPRRCFCLRQRLRAVTDNVWKLLKITSSISCKLRGLGTVCGGVLLVIFIFCLQFVAVTVPSKEIVAHYCYFLLDPERYEAVHWPLPQRSIL